MHQAFDLVGKRRVDLPVRAFLPRNMLGASRVPDIHVLDFRPAINQHGRRVCLKQGVGGKGIEVLHRHIRI
jgi:hypothetical protein